MYCEQSEEVSVAPVIDVSRAALLKRRRAVLARLGATEADFRAALACRRLSGEVWEAKEELDEIEFVLGDDAAGG